MREASVPEVSFIGGVETRSLVPPLLVGSEDFSSLIVTDCFLRVVPDTSIAMTRLSIRSASASPKKFKYRLHFGFIMAFGKQVSLYDFGEHLEGVLVRYLEGTYASGRQEIADEMVIHGRAA